MVSYTRKRRASNTIQPSVHWPKGYPILLFMISIRLKWIITNTIIKIVHNCHLGLCCSRVAFLSLSVVCQAEAGGINRRHALELVAQLSSFLLSLPFDIFIYCYSHLRSILPWTGLSDIVRGSAQLKRHPVTDRQGTKTTIGNGFIRTVCT